MKTISIFFLLFLTVNNSYDVGLSLSQTFTLISNILQPSGFIFQLMKIKLLEVEEDFSCTLCKRIVVAVRTTVEEKYTPDEIINLIALLCSITKDYDYCYNYYSNYGIPFLKNAFIRITNSENFCYTLGFCEEGQLCEDTYDYALRLLKDKPNKKKENIDTTAPTLKMVQVTDIHYDQHYVENGTIYCDTPLCCHEPASQYSRIKSGKFGGALNCDTSINTLKSFVQAAYDLNPDFLIWTGDNAQHDAWNSTQEEAYFATRTIKKEIDEVFKNSIPIYPVIGNHEVYPNDLLASGEESIFQVYADIYKDYFFEDQALETFSKYGYYTEKHPNTNLRIIALNCLYCDTINYHHLSSNHTEAKKEFIWLEQVLREAESNGEYVYILDHFPINSEFTLAECSKRLIAIFDRFDYIIRGYFSGHNHLDDIAPVRRYFEPRPIININYIAPSLTPNGEEGLNPSFRQYIIDSNTKQVIDYEQYRLNLTEANLKGQAVWYLSYTATELFNVSDLTEREQMCSINTEGEYIKKRYSDNASENQMHDKKEILKAECTITTDSYYDYFECTEQSMFTTAYFYKLLNDISGEWGKE